MQKCPRCKQLGELKPIEINTSQCGEKIFTSYKCTACKYKFITKTYYNSDIEETVEELF